VTVTDLIVPLAAVTVMPLPGLAPVVPSAGLKLSWTVLADDVLLDGADEWPLALGPDDVQAAASIPAKPIAMRGPSLRDRLYSCSTLSSRGQDS
jgi:hypothetical protein